MHRQCALGAAASAKACCSPTPHPPPRPRRTRRVHREYSAGLEYKLYAPCMPGAKHCTPPVYAPRAGVRGVRVAPCFSMTSPSLPLLAIICASTSYATPPRRRLRHPLAHVACTRAPPPRNPRALTFVRTFVVRIHPDPDPHAPSSARLPHAPPPSHHLLQLPRLRVVVSAPVPGLPCAPWLARAARARARLLRRAHAPTQTTLICPPSASPPPPSPSPQPPAIPFTSRSLLPLPLAWRCLFECVLLCRC